MSALPLEFPELDFARDPIPDLHAVLADLRARTAVMTNVSGSDGFW